MARTGLEPRTAGLQVGRAEHSATLPPSKPRVYMSQTLNTAPGINVSRKFLLCCSYSINYFENELKTDLYRNKMTSDDQVEAVELLTKVASVTMGLREQMDIIRIINPEATVLPTDTEFEIGTCIINFLQ